MKSNIAISDFTQYIRKLTRFGICGNIANKCSAMPFYYNTLVGFSTLILILVLVLAQPVSAEEQEPALPAGLNDSNSEPVLPEGLEYSENEPSLPAGLEGNSQQSEPTMPEGLEGSSKSENEENLFSETSELPFSFTGFWEIRAGVRTQHDDYEKDASIAETRLQLEIEKDWDNFGFKVTTDLLYDQIPSHHEVYLEDGRGFLDLREANFYFSPFDFMDVKIGRQVLTWGTGDLLFINDMFPKDWQSFFIGRDEEYLKAPSDAMKISLFSDFANLDFVYTPRFDADRSICGRRISYWNSFLRRRAGQDYVMESEKPDDWFKDDEFAWRVYKTINGLELAGYAYMGYWKSPNGMDLLRQKAIHPKLNVFGFSARGNIWKGIGNIELGYYDSRDDRSGDNPFIRNSEFRLLLGYEQEIMKDFTVSFQYYLEHMMHYGAYRDSLWPIIMDRKDENRHVLTVRLTRLLMNQNLTLSLFAYYSPSDGDAYLRPKVNLRVDDHWTVEMGANVFFGTNDYTFFGQFERNSNIYIAARYNF